MFINRTVFSGYCQSKTKEIASSQSLQTQTMQWKNQSSKQSRQPVPGAGHCAEAAILICIKIKLYVEHVLIWMKTHFDTESLGNGLLFSFFFNHLPNWINYILCHLHKMPSTNNSQEYVLGQRS